jgi:hypothetical protein
MDLPDPPGHTVFLYLQELNRKELQKQAKAYGIKANQKNEVLRQKLQEILTARKGHESIQTPVKKQEEEETVTAEATAEATTQTPGRGDENKEADIQDIQDQPRKKQPLQPRKEPARKIASRDFLKARNQESQPKVKFTPSTKTYNKPPTIIKTPTTRRLLGERNMNTRRPLTSSDNSKSTGNVEITKPCPGTPGTVRDVSKIIKTKNSPSKPSTYNSKPLLLTHTRPRPKPMAMSKRNEIQYQKFLERQNKGRKVREQKLKRDEFIHLVRSPVRA